jgi:hypothetical protein
VSKPVLFRDVVEDDIGIETVTREEYNIQNGGIDQYFNTDYIGLQRYRDIMKLNEQSLMELGQTDSVMAITWKLVAKWENAVILAAVFHHVITPRRELGELLGLGSILDADDYVYEGDRTEDALAIKTGGACYGGRIQSEGYRYHDNGRITRRALSTFDKPIKVHRRTPDHYDDFEEDSGFQSLHQASDDAESYDPR